MTHNIVSEKLHSQGSSISARNVIRKMIQFSAEADPWRKSKHCLYQQRRKPSSATSDLRKF